MGRNIKGLFRNQNNGKPWFQHSYSLHLTADPGLVGGPYQNVFSNENKRVIPSKSRPVQALILAANRKMWKALGKMPLVQTVRARLGNRVFDRDGEDPDPADAIPPLQPRLNRKKSSSQKSQG